MVNQVRIIQLKKQNHMFMRQTIIEVQAGIHGITEIGRLEHGILQLRKNWIFHNHTRRKSAKQLQRDEDEIDLRVRLSRSRVAPLFVRIQMRMGRPFQIPVLTV